MVFITMNLVKQLLLKDLGLKYDFFLLFTHSSFTAKNVVVLALLFRDSFQKEKNIDIFAVIIFLIPVLRFNYLFERENKRKRTREMSGG